MDITATNLSVASNGRNTESQAEGIGLVDCSALLIPGIMAPGVLHTRACEELGLARVTNMAGGGLTCLEVA